MLCPFFICNFCSLSRISVLLLRRSTHREEQQKYRQYTRGFVKLILPPGSTQNASQLMPILPPPRCYCHCRKREEMSECQGNHANVIQHRIMVLGHRNHRLWPKTTNKGCAWGKSSVSVQTPADLGLRVSLQWGKKPAFVFATRGILFLCDDDSFIPPRISRTFHFFKLTNAKI